MNQKNVVGNAASPVEKEKRNVKIGKKTPRGKGRS